MAQESWKREEEAAGCQLPEGPILCTNNCGFFGSVTTMNLCSKCYREHSHKQSKIVDMASIKGSGGAATSAASAVATTAAATQQFQLATTPGAADDHLQQQQQEEEMIAISAAPPAVVAVAPPPPKLALAAAIEDSSGGGAAMGDESRRPPSNRCFACRKRVGLTGFKCRCGDVFCPTHRYSDKHNCSFDYRAAGREAIAKANPVVKADKIEKI